jgi:hypothetical protein
LGDVTGLRQAARAVTRAVAGLGGPSLAPLGLFIALTLVVTWPLGVDLHGSLPGDYGDPVFVSWVIGWVARQLTRLIRGDVAALNGFWHANIFHPEPYTLALSEHFVAQTVQVLPIYWLTGNLILCYNVAFLSTFVLTGYGTFLLARDLWGSSHAALAAGIFAAYNPYRLSLEMAHLHALSIQWFPFALVGLHRFLLRGSTPALLGATTAVVALNLSAGYYMLFCAPFIAAFALVELGRAGRLRDGRAWSGLVVAACAVMLVTIPFVMPYVRMQQRMGFARPLAEVIELSATLDHYRAVLPWLSVPLVLAVASILLWIRPASTPGRVLEHAREARDDSGALSAARQRTLAVALLLFLLFAVWLSLGPVVRSGGVASDVPGLYAWLYNHVPGFSGLRAASRFAAIVLIVLPLLAAAGAAIIQRVAGVPGRVGVLALCCVFLWQVWPRPLPTNQVLASPTLASPPSYLRPSPNLPAIYGAVIALDRDAVLVELPFGDPWYDLRYMFFAATHGRRLMNGYSGIFPLDYAGRRRILNDPFRDAAPPLHVLRTATHVIVHTSAWRDDTGARLTAWLESAGATPVASANGAQILALRPSER